jgi:hypothetical protein
MELQELRQKISEAGFSEEVAKKLDEILGKAVVSGSLSPADKAAMMELVDIDIEAGNLEADTMENMAIMLESYASETEGLGRDADEEEQKIADQADAEAAKLEAEMEALKASEAPTQQFNPVSAVPQWSQPVTPIAPVAPLAEQPVVPVNPFPNKTV